MRTTFRPLSESVRQPLSNFALIKHNSSHSETSTRSRNQPRAAAQKAFLFLQKSHQAPEQPSWMSRMEAIVSAMLVQSCTLFKQQKVVDIESWKEQSDLDI